LAEQLEVLLLAAKGQSVGALLGMGASAALAAQELAEERATAQQRAQADRSAVVAPAARAAGALPWAR